MEKSELKSVSLSVKEKAELQRLKLQNQEFRDKIRHARLKLQRTSLQNVNATNERMIASYNLIIDAFQGMIDLNELMINQIQKGLRLRWVPKSCHC